MLVEISDYHMVNTHSSVQTS